MEYTLQGQLEVTARDRKTGEVISKNSYPNSVTTNGIERFLATVIGNESNTLDGTDGSLVLYDSGSTQVFAQSGTDAGPDHTNAEEVFYEWHDDSTNSYTPDNAEIRIGGTGGSIFATISGISFGSKPGTQIWEYKYTLQISGAAFVDATSGIAEGLDSMLMIFSGESGNEWGSGVHLNIYDDTETLVSTITSNVTTRDGTSVDYEWTADAGEHDSGDWEFMEPASVLHVDDWPARYGTGEIPLWYNDENIGSKGANTKRIWTFTLTIS
jgi:hypothetical protein